MSIEETYAQNLEDKGVAAKSGPRTTWDYNGADQVTEVVHRPSTGLHFRLSDPRHLERGRDHDVVVSNHLIDVNYVHRHGDKIAELAARVLNLETRLAAVRAALTDVNEADL